GGWWGGVGPGGLRVGGAARESPLAAELARSQSGVKFRLVSDQLRVTTLSNVFGTSPASGDAGLPSQYAVLKPVAYLFALPRMAGFPLPNTSYTTPALGDTSFRV